MENENAARMKVVRIGLVLSLLTILFGFGLGGVFGAAEKNVKDHLKAQGQKVLDTVYEGDAAAMKKVTDKSWVYFKRAHLHANGLGAISLAAIVLLAFMQGQGWLKKIVAAFLGLGSLGYSLFWMLAALKAPGLGGTGAAREALKLWAIPSTALCIIGLVAVLLIVLKTLCCPFSCSCSCESEN